MGENIKKDTKVLNKIINMPYLIAIYRPCTWKLEYVQFNHICHIYESWSQAGLQNKY